MHFSSDLKKFLNSQLFSLKFQKFFSITRTFFSHNRSEQFLDPCIRFHYNIKYKFMFWYCLWPVLQINTPDQKWYKLFLFCLFYWLQVSNSLSFLHTVRRLEKWFFTSWSTEDKIRRSFLMNCYVCGQSVNQWSLHLYSVAKNQKIALQISQISEVITFTR